MRKTVFGSDLRDDLFAATQIIRETFYGLGGDDTFLVFNGTGADLDADFSDRFIGGAGQDLMAGLNVGLVDYAAYALLSFDGGGGYDTLRFDAGGLIFDATDTVMDLGRFATLARSVEHRAFAVSVNVGAAATGDFFATGSSGDESLLLDIAASTETAVADILNVTVRLNAGDDVFAFVGDPDVRTSLLVDTGKGNDDIRINDTTLRNSDVRGSRIDAGSGHDLVVLEGMNREFVRLGQGNDTAVVLTGGFADVPDTITTGSGMDRIYLELDEYSTIARIRDFDAARDVVVFDKDEFRDTDVTFDAAVAAAAADPVLFMDNATGRLMLGDNIMAIFDGGVTLTAANFETAAFLF